MGCSLWKSFQLYVFFYKRSIEKQSKKNEKLRPQEASDHDPPRDGRYILNLSVKNNNRKIIYSICIIFRCRILVIDTDTMLFWIDFFVISCCAVLFVLTSTDGSCSRNISARVVENNVLLPPSSFPRSFINSVAICMKYIYCYYIFAVWADFPKSVLIILFPSYFPFSELYSWDSQSQHEVLRRVLVQEEVRANGGRSLDVRGSRTGATESRSLASSQTKNRYAYFNEEKFKGTC